MTLFREIHFPGIYTRKVFTFRVYIPGKWRLSGYINPESDHFPGLYTRKVKIFRVYIPGKWKFILRYFSLSGYIDPESDHFPGIYTRKILTFRVYIPGKWSLSGYIYSESEKFPISFFGKKTLKQGINDKKLENFDTQDFSF